MAKKTAAPAKKPATKLPAQYKSIRTRFAKVHTAVETLGKTLKTAGPLNRKTAELIQLAAAASIGSEGSLHSHARRALQAGATPEELYHTVILLTSTVGFPTVSAGLMCIDDVLDQS